MAQETRAELKAKWVTGYVPTQTDFENLFDSIFNYLTDLDGISGIVKSEGVGISEAVEGVDYVNPSALSGLLNETAHDLLDHTGLPGIQEIQDQVDELSQLQTTLIYYLDHTPEGIIASYESLFKSPQDVAGYIETINLNNNTVSFDKYIMPVGQPGIIEYPSGLWIFHAHVNFSAITGNNYVHFDVYKRDLAGTETLLFRASTPDISVSGLIQHQVEVVKTAFTLLSTDRIVLEVLAETTGGAKTAALTYSGSSNYAYIQLPLTGIVLDVGGSIHTATNKTTPVDADELALWDSVTGLLNKLTFANLKANFNTLYGAILDTIIYNPATEPAIATGIITLDCIGYKQAKFEPRKSVGTLAIDEDFEFVFSNISNTDFIQISLSLTGTRIISFPSDVICANESTSGVWNSGTQELTLAMVTSEIVELTLSKYTSTSNWILNVSEKAS